MTSFRDPPARTRGDVIGRALAAIAGDLRDWLPRCGWCGSDQLRDGLTDDHLYCETCGKATSRRMVYEDRCRRARVRP